MNCTKHSFRPNRGQRCGLAHGHAPPCIDIPDAIILRGKPLGVDFMSPGMYDKIVEEVGPTAEEIAALCAKLSEGSGKRVEFILHGSPQSTLVEFRIDELVVFSREFTAKGK